MISPVEFPLRSQRLVPGRSRPLAEPKNVQIGIAHSWSWAIGFFTEAGNRYRSHIVSIDVLNEVSVMPARGAQSC
jgi:hypothetical protein